MFRGHQRRSGFSLVEMVAALTIFGAGAVAVLGVFAICLQSTGTSANYTRACLLAQGLVEEALAEQTLLPEETSGDWGDVFPKATWTREIVETETAGLYEMHVTVTWPERGREREFELTTLAAER